jgi:AcrR family transcriptional regulator
VIGDRPAPSTDAGGAPAQARRLRTQGKKTLRALLDAAIVVFGKRGYHATRVDDIVKRARTSHGTFYLYFSSKEDLFRALVADVTEEMRVLAESLPAVKPSRGGWEELRTWVARFCDIYVHYDPVIRAWTEVNAQNSDMARLGTRVLRQFSDQLEERVRQIDPPTVSDPAVAAFAMVSMLERVSSYAALGMVPGDRDALIDTLASILHVGLFGGVRRRRP